MRGAAVWARRKVEVQKFQNSSKPRLRNHGRGVVGTQRTTQSCSDGIVISVLTSNMSRFSLAVQTPRDESIVPTYPILEEFDYPNSIASGSFGHHAEQRPWTLTMETRSKNVRFVYFEVFSKKKNFLKCDLTLHCLKCGGK